MQKRLLVDERNNLTTKTAALRRLVHNNNTTRLLHRRDDRLNVERPKRPEIHDLTINALSRRLVGRIKRLVKHRAPDDDRDVFALANDARLAQRHRVIALRHLALGRTINSLRLKEHHRIRITNRRKQKALRVGRVRRTNHLQTRAVDELRLRVLRVIMTAANAAANRRANHELGRILAA